MEHPAGRAHDDAIRLLCVNCHRKRTADQRCDPSAGPNPRNVFEVIGRWLLSLASYFELLRETLRRFGEFLISLAKAGYGDDLTSRPSSEPAGGVPKAEPRPIYLSSLCRA